MTYRGQVKNGVVVLEGERPLPDGMLVIVQPLVELPSSSKADDLEAMTDLAIETGIPDLASNIDHYLYGHPKATDGV